MPGARSEIGAPRKNFGGTQKTLCASRAKFLIFSHFRGQNSLIWPLSAMRAKRAEIFTFHVLLSKSFSVFIMVSPIFLKVILIWRPLRSAPGARAPLAPPP